MSSEQKVLYEDVQVSVGGKQQREPLTEMLKLRVPNRNQLAWGMIDVEELIPGDHKARAIWELAGLLDLKPFKSGLRTQQGDKGRSAWDARLLVSIWVYALSEGIGSAREIERLMGYEPGLRWLSGLEVINHHTLSDFRAAHKEGLDKIFTELLALLAGEGLVTLDLVAHDGTKVAAQAGGDSFRREQTVRERLERAEKLLRELDREEPREGNLRRRAAQLRAAREQQKRLEEGLAELALMQCEKGSEEERQNCRVSVTDPEARIMKHADQSFGPAYNVQITTDAKHKVIVGMELTQTSSDAPGLIPGLEQVAQRMGQLPRQAVVDGAYTSERNILEAEDKQLELVGTLGDVSKRTENALKSSGIAPEFGPGGFVENAESNSLQCPAGKQLRYFRQNKKRNRRYRQYRALASDCAACEYRSKCCPKSQGKGRMVSILVEESAGVVRFRERMAGPEAKGICKRRGEIAEFPNAWIKEKIGLRKFRLRGLAKSKTEALWAGLTYNVMVWIRLVWRTKVMAAAVGM